MRLKLSIARFEVSVPELKLAVEGFAQNRIKAIESVVEDGKRVIADFLNQAMHAEMTLFLGKPNEADNKRNGYEERDYTFKGLGTLRVKVPVDRKRRFNSVIIPKNERMDPRLSEDMAALHLAGISTRTLALMSKRILGIEVSHQTVSSSLDMLSGEAQKWLTRPISEEYWALIIDGTYFKVRRRGSVEREPSLVVLGISSNNRRSILAIEPGTRDSADAWRAVFHSLKQRGLDATRVRVGVMDGLPGLEKAFREDFPKAITARCWFHSLQNAAAKTPKRLHDAFLILAKKVMYADGEVAARAAFGELEAAMDGDCQRAVDCLRKDLDSLVSHFKFPKKIWKALKTTNAVERIHKEFKRRSRSMEGVGEDTLTTLLAFTAMRLEMTWRRRAIDSYADMPPERLGIPFLDGGELAITRPELH